MGARRPVVLLAVPMLHPDGRAILDGRFDVVDAAGPDAVPGLVGGADALYVYPPVTVDRALLERGARLRVVAAGGSGVDNIDVEAAAELGVVVTHAVGAGATAVAEHTVGLMLCLAKRLVWTDRMTRAGRFDVRSCGGFEELAGRTLAVVGYGSVGREVARICAEGFRMEVVPVPRGGPLDEALAAADVVSVHVPLTATTRGMFGDREFSLMRPGAWFLNTSRGAVVDEAALVRALAGGRLAGAGIDVFDPEPPSPGNPLFTFDNVVVSPHDAGVTAPAFRRLAVAAAEDIRAVLEGRRPRCAVGP